MNSDNEKRRRAKVEKVDRVEKMDARNGHQRGSARMKESATETGNKKALTPGRRFAADAAHHDQATHKPREEVVRPPGDTHSDA